MFGALLDYKIQGKLENSLLHFYTLRELQVENLHKCLFKIRFFRITENDVFNFVAFRIFFLSDESFKLTFPENNSDFYLLYSKGCFI